MSHQNCERCGARYRDEHTCEDVAEMQALKSRVEAMDTEIYVLRKQLMALAKHLGWTGPT